MIRHEVLNAGLMLSMEWGKEWLCSVNDRLSFVFPELTEKELDQIDNYCKRINAIGNRYVYENPIIENGTVKFPLIKDFSAYMMQKFAWISADNMTKLYSQSCYYARK